MRVFAHHFEAIQNGRADTNSGAVLVIVEDRYFHAFAQFALDIKAVRCLDVFQIDAAKSRLQRGDDVDQFVKVMFFINFDVKHVNAGKLFKQNTLALHHRLGGQGANVAQAQNGCAIGDHGHQVATRRVFESIVGVFDDFLTGRRHAR